MSLSPILNLPVRWQQLAIDVESLQPWRGFSADGYDVANVNGTLLVENPAEQEVRLVCPFPTEQASAEVRVLSTDKKSTFKKGRGGARQFVALLRALGQIPADQEPMLRELQAATREFRVADIQLPAGQQLLRFHARQRLRPVGGDVRSYEVVFFAPLAGFVLAPGRAEVSVTLEFPTPFAGPGMTLGTPVVTPLPGAPTPEAQVTGPVVIAERQTYGWLWRVDPKVTFPYRYA